MTITDIRWQQRFRNFLNAFALLEEAVKLSSQKKLSDLEKQGLIQRFEFTHELAWKVLKDYLEFQGIGGITGSRDATRLGFKNGLLIDGEGWMEMIKSRNESSHTYNEKIAENMVKQILEKYYTLFLTFKDSMSKLIQ